MTLKSSTLRYGKSLEMKDNLLNKVEKIMAKGEIARFKQLLLLSQCSLKSTTVDMSK